MVTENKQIKILEFGFCHSASQVEANNLHSTPYYMAPEVTRGNTCTTSSDVWSLGVLLYIFLSGFMPFSASNKADLFDLIDDAKLSFHHAEFKNVSAEAKDLISKMIVRNPSKRISCQTVLTHPWFKKFAVSSAVPFDSLD